MKSAKIGFPYLVLGTLILQGKTCGLSMLPEIFGSGVSRNYEDAKKVGTTVTVMSNGHVYKSTDI